MGDFLGHVRVRVDRNKPLAESVSVYLDACPRVPQEDDVPPDSIGELYLHWRDFLFKPNSFENTPFTLSICDCVIAERGKSS